MTRQHVTCSFGPVYRAVLNIVYFLLLMLTSPVGIILCMHRANERWCYLLTSSLIGLMHTHNDPWFWSTSWKNMAHVLIQLFVMSFIVIYIYIYMYVCIYNIYIYICLPFILYCLHCYESFSNVMVISYDLWWRAPNIEMICEIPLQTLNKFRLVKFEK